MNKILEIVMVLLRLVGGILIIVAIVKHNVWLALAAYLFLLGSWWCLCLLWANPRR